MNPKDAQTPTHRSMPDVLFLYLSAPSEKADTTDLLMRRRLKLSCVGNLNDPFDMIPALKANHSPAEIRKYLEETQGRFERKEPVTARLIAEVKARLDRIGRDPYNEWPKIAEHIRLLCLSSRADGVLLWSHYASNHKGFAIGLRTSELIGAIPSSALFEVEYSRDRVPVGPGDFIDHAKMLELLLKLFSRKSPEWQYEAEWRAIHHESDLAEGRYLLFRPEAVDCLILGSRIEPSVESILRKACSSGGIGEDVSLLRSELSHERFEIVNKPTRWRR